MAMLCLVGTFLGIAFCAVIFVLVLMAYIGHSTLRSFLE